MSADSIILRYQGFVENLSGFGPPIDARGKAFGYYQCTACLLRDSKRAIEWER